jgi:hypothetical protein
MRHTLLRTALLALLLLSPAACARAQDNLAPVESALRRWVASAAFGVVSPFGTNDFSNSWRGVSTFMATLEYAPARDATFGFFVSRTRFIHSGWTPTGYSGCWEGIERIASGGGLSARVYVARADRLAMTLGGTVGALSVTVDRPVFVDGEWRPSGSLFPPSLDLEVGASLGLEFALLPQASLSVDVGYEGVENQISLAQSMLVRTALRVGL